MRPAIQGFFHPPTGTISYLVSDPASKVAAIVDPVLDYEPCAARVSSASADAVVACADRDGLKVEWILETHAHADHLSAGDYLRRKLGAKLGIGAKITDIQKIFGRIFAASDVRPEAFDRLFEDGDTFALGELTVRVLHTPGHTPACISYLIGDAVFVGDTMFMPDYGTARADFPGGDAATLYRSIRRLLDLPPQTRVFVGHDYLPAGRVAHAWETTVEAQKTQNVWVHEGVEEAEFVARRVARDATLSPPTLILPALQVNIRAGALPPAEADGTVFLKLPVNAI